MSKTIYFLFILLLCPMSGQRASKVVNAEKLVALKEKGVKLVDIRTKGEYEQSHIPGAVHIGFLEDGFVERMKQKAPGSVIIHCASGGRSRQVAKILQRSRLWTGV